MTKSAMAVTRGLLILFGATVLFSAAFAAMEPLDRIVAIVGNDPILSSELAAQIQMAAIQRNIRPQNQQEVEKLQKEVLDQMISEKLFLAEAKKDTSIKTTPDEVDKALEDHIRTISSQFPSEDQFLAELSKEGLNLRTFKKRLRPEVENELLKQKLISKKLADISISRQEVMEFYNKYKDSIPDQPEAVRLAHILITFQPSKKTEDSVKALAESVRKNAAAGADFATLAATYSSGQNGINGGDLGFISRDDAVPEFSRAAFNLAPGQISGVVRTQFGYHIIKCEEVAGDKAHLRQILFEVLPTAADSQLTYHLVDSLKNEIVKGADFREIAKVYSADDDTRKQGGELGWFAVSDLPAEFQAALDSMKNIGDIYGPVKSQYGLHILKLLEHQDARKFSFDSDYDRVKEMARNAKTGEYVNKWVAEAKERTYVEVRPLGPAK
ncbi:PpiC-type peptidyl-prolyl cis-trans isomerase [Candidatus Zixiibacteriota bacterium]|nr:PpiC-type peptidyl-prolyl cis-trans isomerase [candidate division Zixibacteria bacterium]